MPAAVQCRVLKSHLPESRLLAAALRELRTSRVLACNESSQFTTAFRLQPTMKFFVNAPLHEQDARVRPPLTGRMASCDGTGLA